ncbi:hypothetical protein GPECTOR_10g1019 [Gonium pectorale]|uniref:Uncharacterized protein n=1 Tax=Gonium pectorale TaxID=33097 RepID=A0A150GQ85_GONPE|nr:hypothetical protein GPECTOR_10g1019 [Gonium pectorale]|eukprot:KXZ51997.1 hypothetical protein GPECTOR_10g1019 [Gonium pectorale]
MSQVTLYVPKWVVSAKIFPKLLDVHELNVLSYEDANQTVAHADLLFFVTAEGHLVGLSPHVVHAIESHGFPASWWLGINTVHLRSNGSLVCTGLRNETLKQPWGFAVQGTIDKARRHYDVLYDPLLSLLNTSGSVPFVKIVGQLHTPLDIPPPLKDVIRLYINLPFDQYFNLIECSQALLPVFGSSSYVKNKFSSTVLASLISAVPVLADDALLSAYSFLSEATAFKQMSNETVVDAMQRISKLPWIDHQIRRDNLVDLAERLNVAAGSFLVNLLT